MSEDEEDPVVSEMDVYLSHALEKQLYLLQYPTQPAASSQENEDIIKCSFKPENQELVMEIAVDTNNPNYDTSHGEQIAVNVDGGKGRPSNERFFDGPMMNKRCLQSTKVAVDMGSVAIATVKNNQLVITPIQGILSVQPSFPHLDITDKRSKEEAKEKGEDVSGGEEEEVEKQVTVKFARQESERVKKAREQSFNSLSKKSAEEKWYHTEYYNASSRMSEVERGKLVSVDVEDRQSTLCLTPQQYMDNLVPEQQDPTWSLPSLPAHVTSLTALSKLPFPDMVSTVLKEVKIITFRQLSSLLAGHGDAVKLLRCVQQVAVLVLGNWVVRSECLYPHDSFSDMNGVPGDVMCRARDYILYLFSQGKVLERKQIAATVRLPPEELKQLLSQVSRLRKHKGWELLLPPDDEFIERNPDVVERQFRAWSTKYAQIMEAFESEASNSQVTKGRSRRRESSMSGGSDLEGPVRVRQPRHRKDSCLSSDPENGPECGVRRKRNSESHDGRKIQTENLDNKSRKKRNSESSTGKTRKSKSEIVSPEPVS